METTHRAERVSTAGRAAVWRRVQQVLGPVMWLLLVAYVVGLVRHGEGFEPLVDGWLGTLTQLLPAAICWSSVPLAADRRREVVVMAAGVSAFAAGNLVYVLTAAQQVVMPYPSYADLCFLWFYPAALAALALAVRREHRTVRGSIWLDCLMGGLAAAAVLAMLLGRVIERAAGSPLEVAVFVAYPVFELLLIAAVVGIVALQAGRTQPYWLPLLGGLALFTTADIVLAFRLSADSYVLGTPLDALWAGALTLMTLWVRAQPAARDVTDVDQPVALAVPALATAAGLAVLVVASRNDVSMLAISLAGLTLAVTAGRTQLAFRQLRRLADLRRQATTDDLTGLPNRRAFYADVTARLTAAGSGSALLLLDLDRFKEVNDTLGHHVGDELLSLVGARLSAQLRHADPLARLGGDEFGVLLANSSRQEASAVAAKLRAALVEPFSLGGLSVRTDVSIGIALAPEHGNDVTVLLRRADIAMYKAKGAREGQRFFDGDTDDDSGGGERLRTVQELRTAVAEGQLILHYQPKVDLRTDQVHGVEALVRWEHPTRGLLYPDSFLTLVEDVGLMRSLTQVVLELALDQAVAWRAAGRPLTVAVNLSASSLVDTDLPEQVAALLLARRLPASALQLRSPRSS